MHETPPDKPLMTFAPDGYIPRRMQLQKVTGVKISRAELEPPEKSTSASKNFLRRSIDYLSTHDEARGIFITTTYATASGISLHNGWWPVAVGMGLVSVGAGANMLLSIARK